MKNLAFKSTRFVFCTMGAMFILTPKAYAYVDPATTSYVVQIVAGIIIACGTGIGIFWNRAKRKLKKKDSNTEPAETSADRVSKGGVMTADDLLDDNDPDNKE